MTICLFDHNEYIEQYSIIRWNNSYIGQETIIKTKLSLS